MCWLFKGLGSVHACFLLFTTVLYLWCFQPIDKQSLLDSGILCCLIHILNALLNPDEANQNQKATDREEPTLAEKKNDGDASQVRRLEVAFT